MKDFLEQIQWDDFYRFLTDGHPSLLLQLLVINTLFVILIIIKRMRQHPNPRQRTHFFLQELLLVANVLVLSQDRFMPFFNSNIEPLIYQFKHRVL